MPISMLDTDHLGSVLITLFAFPRDAAKLLSPKDRNQLAAYNRISLFVRRELYRFSTLEIVVNHERVSSHRFTVVFLVPSIRSFRVSIAVALLIVRRRFL